MGINRLKLFPMSLRYARIKSKPIFFQRLFGISPQHFKVIFQKVQSLWEKKLKREYKRPGRDFKLSLEDIQSFLTRNQKMENSKKMKKTTTKLYHVYVSRQRMCWLRSKHLRFSQAVTGTKEKDIT